MYAAGVRVSELCGLRPLDFDPQSDFLRIWGKGAKERIVPVHALAAKLLQAYLTSWRPLFKPQQDRIFLNRSGRGLTRQGVWKIVRKHAEAVGLTVPISPHTLRHTFATHLLEGGANLRTVQTLLGHEDINATEIYTLVQKRRIFEMHQKYHPRSSSRDRENTGTR
jgi:integrase/recombinase XerD